MLWWWLHRSLVRKLLQLLRVFHLCCVLLWLQQHDSEVLSRLHALL